MESDMEEIRKEINDEYAKDEADRKWFRAALLVLGITFTVGVLVGVYIQKAGF